MIASLKYIFGLVVLACLSLYIAYGMVWDDFGLRDYWKLRTIRTTLSQELISTKKQVEALTVHVNNLSSDTLKMDLLEERLKDTFGFHAPTEYLILPNKEE